VLLLTLNEEGRGWSRPSFLTPPGNCQSLLLLRGLVRG
jgi:hypothetical protein